MMKETNVKDVIDQAEKLRDEFKAKFKGWKIHHKDTPCIKDDYVINEIADFWLSKYSSYTKDLLQSVKTEIKEMPCPKQWELQSWEECKHDIINNISKE